MDASIEAKVRLYERFWRGEGPSLILIPGGANLYDLRITRAFSRPPRHVGIGNVPRGTGY